MNDLLIGVDRRTGDELLLVDLSLVTTEAEANQVLTEFVTPNRKSHLGFGFGWPMSFRWRGSAADDPSMGVRAQPEPPHSKSGAIASILRHAPHWNLDVTDVVTGEVGTDG